MTLSHDTARCNGHTPFGITHPTRNDCQRRTETVHSERQSWMRPPPVINNICPERLGPIEEKI